MTKTIDDLIDEEASAPPTVDELFDGAANDASYQPYTGESRFGNIAFRDLTFGLGPRILAAAETGAVSGPEYTAAKERRNARNDAYSYDNPGSALGASLLGALPTAFVPGLGTARVGRAALQGAEGATRGLSMGQRALRAIGVGREIGDVGHEAGLVGAKYAGLYGGLGSREEDPAGRLYDAAKSIPLGYVAGRGANAVLGPAIGVGEYADTARRVGGNADMGARMAMRRDIDRSGTTVAALRREVLPGMGSRKTTDDAVEAALLAYNRDDPVGSVQAMRTAYSQRLADAGISLKEKTINDHVARIRGRIDGETTVPLNITEVARRAGSSGENLSWTQRVAAATPGESRETLRRTIEGRQDEIIPTVRNWIDRRVGGADLEGSFDDLVARNRQNANRFYGVADDTQKPIDLRDFVAGKERAVAPTLRGENRDVYNQALAVLRNVSDAAPKGQRHTLQTYIQANSELNDLIGKSYIQRMGREQATSITGPLIELKKAAQDIVTQSNPNWRVANDLTAGGKGVERLVEDIGKIGSDALLSGRGAKARRMINRISSIRSELSRLSTSRGEPRPGLSASDLARRALLEDQAQAADTAIARAMHDVMDGLGDKHDLSKKFLKGGAHGGGPKAALRRLIGEGRHDEFADLVERSNMATATRNAQYNSQTEPMRAAREELDAEGKVAGFARILGMVGSPSEMLKELSLMAARRFNQDRNRRLGDYYSTMTDDPAAFLSMLRRIENDDVVRSPVFGRDGVNAYSAPPAIGGAFSATPLAGQQSYDEKYGY